MILFIAFKRCQLQQWTILLLLILQYISVEVKGDTHMRHFLRILSDQEQTTRRPVIHTFICVDDCKTTHSLEDDSITGWAKVWANAGWDPVVLSEKDAKRHPQYEKYMKQLDDAKLPPSRWYRYLRYMAMSTQEDGGWYAESDVIPIVHSNIFNGKGLALPNDGKFTMHDGHLPHLLSGDKDAWEIVTIHMINDREIMNDILLLHILTNDQPEIYMREESMLNVKHIIDSNLNSNVNCTMLDKRLATVIPEDELNKHTHNDYYNAVNIALEDCNPVIYSFFEMAYYDKNAQDRANEDVEEWKKAWKGAGWQPVVLKLEDAKRHPIYEELKKMLDSGFDQSIEYEKMCFYRWLAVSISGGGWMADYDTYPLHIDPNIYGHNLPNNGKFTSHCWKAPCLVSGSEAEWNRVIPLMLHSLEKHNAEQWSDMFAMQEILLRGQIIREMGHANIHEVHDPALLLDDSKSSGVKRACDATKDRLVMHFSHYSCDKARFCHRNRGTVLTKWLYDWRRHCAANSF